jgi:hypothetical protein
LGRDGSLSEIWHAKVKYSLETYVSDDGVHFVQVESTVFGQKPEATDVGLRFYSRGELIASYSPLQFLNAKAQLKKSISHYYWLDTDDKCHAVVLSNQFVLTTIDKTEHCFDMSTGKELKK